MAETHELRLKINAAAAKTGSREFISAIELIKRAVMNLERTSAGAFKRLSKNSKDAARSASIKIAPVSRAALSSLDAFAKLQAQAMRAATSTRRGIMALNDGIRMLGSAYGAARVANDAFTQSLIRSSSALSRQAALAQQVTAAARTSRPAASPVSARGTSQIADQQVAQQNRIRRAVDDSRVSVERLTLQLSKVGGLTEIQHVASSFRIFQKELSGTSVSADKMDAAQTRLNTAIRRGQSEVLSLTAKLQAEKTATAAAANAARQKAEAHKKQEAAIRANAAATAKSNAATAKQAALSVTSAGALRKASEEVARLTERMRRVGDTTGISNLNAALLRFRAAVGGGVTSTAQLKSEMSHLADATSRAKTSLIGVEGAERRVAKEAGTLARQSRDAATSARRVEREMRSVAGASSAASRAMREATGSMRGLENAFNASFQIGSAFRVMLGSITFGTFTKEVFAAGAAMQQFRVVMEVATGSVAGASDQIDFINNMALTLGTNLRGARDDFGKFAISASLAGVSTAATRDIFRSVSQAMAVMGRGAEDQRLAFLALEQMLSKNTISSEELRRQLGERLPGAVNLMARAVGVSTQELQKMLKAGTLISSEVLPKFAREVDKAFGPGLEKALKRAPAALGRLQNQFELALQAISDSGFIDSLSKGFDRLNVSMQQAGAQRAIQKLGENLSKLTTIAVDFAVAFVDNLETVGRVTRAIVGGILIRQAFLLGNALIVAAQRGAVAFSVLTGWMAGNTQATIANTAAQTANNSAMFISSRAAAVKAASLSALTKATSRLTIGTVAANAGMVKMGVTMAGVSAGSTRLAAGMAGFTRVLGGLAGWVGVAVTALLLIPVIFGDIGNGAESMADKIDAAVRRSGVSFDDFSVNAQRAASSIELSRTLTDIETLSNAVSTFTKINTVEVSQLKTAIQELGKGITTTARGTSAIGAFGGLFGAEDAQLIGELDKASRSTIKTLAEMTVGSLNTGRGFLYLRDRIAEAIITNPGAAPILATLAEMTKELALAELSLVSNREKLVELYGTADEKLVKSFSDMGVSVIDTGKGFDVLKERMLSMAKETPRIKGDLEEVFFAVQRALNTGTSSASFRDFVLNIFGDSIREIERLRKSVTDAQAETAKSGVAFAEKFAETLKSLQSRESIFAFGARIDPQFSKQLQSIITQFEKFKDFPVGLSQVSSIIDNFKFPNDQAKQFSDIMLDQFTKVPEGARTYEALDAILVGLGNAFPTANTAAFEKQLRDTISTGRAVGLSTSELIDSLRTLKLSLTTTETKDFIQDLIEQAEALHDDEVAALAAAQGLDAVANAALAAGAAGVTGADGLAQILDMLNKIRGAGFAAAGSIQMAIREIEAEIEQKKMNYVDRAVAVSLESHAKLIRDNRQQIQQTYNDAMAKAVESGVGTTGPFAARALADRDAAMAIVDKSVEDLADAARRSAETPTNNTGRPKSIGGSSGGASKTEKELKKAAAAIKKLTDALQENVDELDAENAALAMLATGLTKSKTAAKLLAEAQIGGANLTREQTLAFIEQIEAAELLNRALTKLANDPVNDWMNSVPSWREAGQQIEVGVFESLSDAISNMIQTGKFDFESLGAAILGTIADIVADKAVKELANLLGANTTGTGEGGFGLGGLFGGLFSSRGDEADPLAGGADSQAMLQALATGSKLAAETIREGMIEAGRQVGEIFSTKGREVGNTVGAGLQSAAPATGSIIAGQVRAAGPATAAPVRTAITTSGTNMSSNVGTAIRTAGNSAAVAMGSAISTAATSSGILNSVGGFWGLLTTVIGMFSEGGMSNAPVQMSRAPIASFRHAPSYASGTPNTSGIPAMLHENEAVIPLSGGRKIPVDIEDGVGGKNNGARVLSQTFNISTPDADSFRRSQSQIASEAAAAGQRALAANG